MELGPNFIIATPGAFCKVNVLADSIYSAAAVLSFSTLKPCHFYLMFLFKTLGSSWGLQMAQGCLHASVCPSGVHWPLWHAQGAHPWSNIYFPGCWAALLARQLQASKARMSPCGRSASGSVCDVNRHLDKHKRCSTVLYSCYTFPWVKFAKTTFSCLTT